ncbi:MAG: hypothetical protein EHM61_19570 [Acidobacteria bacterium]|nr:MAG: hypothetical protein EHM61_19570 [Acidobacteriota bacterium]
MKRNFFFTALVTTTVLLVLSSPAFAGSLDVRVNAGASAPYTDKAGNTWQADKAYTKGNGFGFVGGDTVDRGSDVKIEGTADPRIYQTEHYAMDSFVAEVPNGTYTVRLHFAETYEDITFDGPRVFDVKIQGAEAVKDLDIAKAAGALKKAFVQETKGVQVSDGLLKIQFVSKQQNPAINGVEIVSE